MDSLFCLETDQDDAQTSSSSTNMSTEAECTELLVDYLNPFVRDKRIGGRFYWLKVYIMSLVLVPIRTMGFFISLMTAWLFATIGQMGLTSEQQNRCQITGWRRGMQVLTRAAVRMMFASVSLQWLSVKGKPSTAAEAPIVVVAPHSTYADAIVALCLLNPPSLVAKGEMAKYFVFGKIISFTQPIFVMRDDPNSRQNVLQQIHERAQSGGHWPQMLIFPEGTCSNGRTLIKFKVGAFAAGVPVQPVLLRFPRSPDTFSWTWSSPGALYLLWLTMTNLHSSCQIEFLPVYRPNEEECKNAKLYAENVRTVMAEALQLPKSDYAFEDGLAMSRAELMRVPFSNDIVELERKMRHFNLLEQCLHNELVSHLHTLYVREETCMAELAALLHVELQDRQFQRFFSLMDRHCCGFVNLKEFLICLAYCRLRQQHLILFLQAVATIYAPFPDSIPRHVFLQIMTHSDALSKKKWDAVFSDIDDERLDCIAFEDFKAYTAGKPEFAFLYGGKKTKSSKRRKNHKKKLSNSSTESSNKTLLPERPTDEELSDGSSSKNQCN